MSDLRVTSLKGRKPGSAPSLPDGAVVSGVTTSASFSGNVTGNITGTATGNVTGNVTGNITGTAGTFSGNVSVGGAVTYENTTSIDSVGVVTARTGIKIGAGQSVSAVSGIVTYYGDGSKLTGVESGVVNFVASGTIPNGSTVIIKTDGTVSVIAQTGSADPSVGTPVTVNSLNSSPTSAYDASSGKVVIVWADWNGSAYGAKAIVGTINPSNNSITFGSVATFHNAMMTYQSATYDSANGKVVVCYCDGAGYIGRAKVGTVSGNSISFGGVATFNSGQSTRLSSVSTANGKVVVAYTGTSDYGTAVVGTVSGTSISFGSAVVFNSRLSYEFACAYDSTNDKVAVFYQDQNNSSSGRAKVGTISGTSISFGTPVVFNTSASHTGMTYDSAKDKVIIAFEGDSPAKGLAIVGTISGTSISFGTKIQYESVGAYKNSPVYDSANGRVSIAYKATSADYLFAVVLTTNSIETNLTSENYIGIAAEAISNGATGKINVVAGTNTGQTGLTTAQKYFVQTNGTLGTSAGNPSVVAGTAISDTKIVVR